MRIPACLSTLLFAAMCMPTLAQEWTQEDSLRLQRILSGEEDLEIRPEDISGIRLETPLPGIFPESNPFKAQQGDILHFNHDLPSSFLPGDTLTMRPRVYLTLRPYGIFGFAQGTEALPMAVKIPLREKQYAKSTPRPTTVSFSMDNVLLYLFSKKGRARIRNAQNANAWKTY